jgi:hypothetical protein
MKEIKNLSLNDLEAELRRLSQEHAILLSIGEVETAYALVHQLDKVQKRIRELMLAHG